MMGSIQGSSSHAHPLFKLVLAIQQRMSEWVRREIIDDDPFDQEAWREALLLTQEVLHTEAIPKDLL